MDFWIIWIELPVEGIGWENFSWSQNRYVFLYRSYHLIPIQVLPLVIEKLSVSILFKEPDFRCIIPLFVLGK